LFTKVIDNRLTIWAENYNVYIGAKAGFRENMSNVDNILHGLINQENTLSRDYYGMRRHVM